MQNDTAPKRGKPFASGNKFGKGRKAGSRNKATLAIDELLEGEGEAIARKLIQFAKKGDPTAMRLAMERLCPPRRERRLQLDLPEIKTVDDVTAAFQNVLQGVAAGQVSAGQAVQLTQVLEFGRKAIETQQLARDMAEMRVDVQAMKENYERRAA
jgi:hypothetical protein